MKGLDISKMKKVSEDDKCATFKHKDGHTVKVALHAVSPELRKQISKLPSHMSEGGESSISEARQGKLPEEEMTPPAQEAPVPAAAPAAPPASININLGPQGAQPYSPSPLMAQPQGAQAPEAPAAQPQAKPQAQPQAPPQALPQDLEHPPEPSGAMAPEMTQGQQEAKPTIQQQMTQEQMAWENDLKNGHIQPKTYADLFANKSTPGKIGMLFGMLLGGMGSGLTHQPNMLMEMMNKEIERDLESQKQSKVNAQNFLRYQQQQSMNKAQIGQLGAQTELTKKETEVKDFGMTQIRMLQASFHNEVQRVAAMPEGPRKQEAQQMLGQVYAKMGDKINAIKDHVAGASALANTLYAPAAGGAGGEEQQFQNQITGMRRTGTPEGQRRAEELESKHIPGIPGQSSRPIPEHLRSKVQAMTVLDDKGKDVLGFIKNNLGTWNPQKRAVAEQKVEELKNFYNNSIEGGALTEGRLHWYDEQFKKDPVSIVNNLLGSTKRLEEVIKSNSQRKDLELKGLGFQGSKQAGGAVRMQAPDGSIKMVPANQVDAALKAKGKRLD